MSIIILIIVAIIFAMGLACGAIYVNIIHETKRRNRHKRRERIIQKQKNVIEEINRWEIEHPERLHITRYEERKTK